MTPGTVEPYFTVSRDFSPDDGTVEVEVYRGEDDGRVFYERTPGYREFLEELQPEQIPPEENTEIDTESVRFNISAEEADDYFQRLADISSDFEISEPVGYDSRTYRLEMFSQIGEYGEICRWDQRKVPKVVEEVLNELEETALNQLD